MSEVAEFIAMPFDLTDHGLVAGEPFKCATPASAIECVRRAVGGYLATQER